MKRRQLVKNNIDSQISVYEYVKEDIETSNSILSNLCMKRKIHNAIIVKQEYTGKFAFQIFLQTISTTYTTELPYLKRRELAFQ